MKGSIQIAKILEIPVKVHWSFLLLLGWVIFEGRRSGMDWEGVGWFGFLIFTLFGCVLLHEFGHALSARRYGVKTKDIILSPFGGVARLNGLPEKPIHEFVVAIAGPMVNIAIACVLGGVGWMSSTLHIDLQETRIIFGEPENFVSLLLALNVFLAVFNLVPAFPMDGGRIFRSLLSIKLGRLKATRIASWFGQVIAVVFFTLAYYSDTILTNHSDTSLLAGTFVLMGVFVFSMATQEYQMVKYEDTLKNSFVSNIMRPQYTAFQKSHNITLAVDEIKRGLEKDFIVINETGTVIGTLQENDILKAAKKKDNFGTVANYMLTTSERVSPNETLDSFYKKLQSTKAYILPVFENEILIGVLDIRQLNDFLKLQQKLK